MNSSKGYIDNLNQLFVELNEKYSEIVELKQKIRDELKEIGFSEITIENIIANCYSSFYP